MLGVLILFLLVGIEIILMILRIKDKSYQTKLRNQISIGIFFLMVFLAIFQVVKLSFRWYLLYLVLLFEAIRAVIYLLKFRKNNLKLEKPFKASKVIFTAIRRSIFVSFLLFFAIMFPQFKDLPITGEYTVDTNVFTIEDTNRIESYSTNNENRKVTLQLWYPKVSTSTEKFPLLIFSHGSFGFKGSNLSTFMELASNGYVVLSVDHTYYSFFTRQTDGKTVIVDQTFLNDVIAVQNDDYDDDITYKLTREWLDTRLADLNLVIDFVMDNTVNNHEDDVFQIINTEKIGVFGHSIGGASAAQLARIRNDIDAVVVVDGTLLGEDLEYNNNQLLLNTEPYPVPILDIFNEDHYEEALENKEIYPNMVMAKNAIDCRQIVFKDAGHLNFTDLPMFSPFLASLLGTGDIDSRYCIETMNQVILSFFDYYLKDSNSLNLQSEY